MNKCEIKPNPPIEHFKQWEDLRSIVMPRVAALLGTSIDQISIATLPTEHLHTKFRDRAIKRIPFADGMPDITQSALHGPSSPSFGITLFSCRQLPKLKYVSCVMRGEYGPVRYHFVKKNELFKIVRNCQRMEKLAVQKFNPPVIDEAILEDVRNSVIGFIKYEKLIEKYDVTMNRGILLDGAPGNGKTMLCRYIMRLCHDNNISCGKVTSSELDNAYKNNMMDSLFQKAQVIFFDDIDVGYLTRVVGGGDSRMACSMLTAMDGMAPGYRLGVRIFTTNESVETLDSAFVRPGRIDRRITIKKPNATLRRKMVERWKADIRENIDVDKFIGDSEGWSGAQVDAVKGFLVEGFISQGVWDLRRAVKLAEGGGFTNKSHQVGFMAESKPQEAMAG